MHLKKSFLDASRSTGRREAAWKGEQEGRCRDEGHHRLLVLCLSLRGDATLQCSGAGSAEVWHQKFITQRSQASLAERRCRKTLLPRREEKTLYWIALTGSCVGTQPRSPMWYPEAVQSSRRGQEAGSGMDPPRTQDPVLFPCSPESTGRQGPRCQPAEHACPVQTRCRGAGRGCAPSSSKGWRARDAAFRSHPSLHTAFLPGAAPKPRALPPGCHGSSSIADHHFLQCQVLGRGLGRGAGSRHPP